MNHTFSVNAVQPQTAATLLEQLGAQHGATVPSLDRKTGKVSGQIQANGFVSKIDYDSATQILNATVKKTPLLHTGKHFEDVIRQKITAIQPAPVAAAAPAAKS